MKAWTTRVLIWLNFTALLVLGEPAKAYAGMPVVLLSDLARLRFQVISFFLLVLLLGTWVIQGIWNVLAKDFPRLPHLNFGKALGLVTIWGLLFLLVLTMIAGARELMTPGAWKKQGLTYVLPEDRKRPDRAPEEDSGQASDKSVETSEDDPVRREILDRLRVLLWKYALTHQGRFPSYDSGTDIPEKAWRIADPSGLHFVYRPGLKADEENAPLAYEPGIFGRDRWVLFTDGSLKKTDIGELRNMIGIRPHPPKLPAPSRTPRANGR